MNRVSETAKQSGVLDAALTLSLDLQGVKLIEASAGTGKTYTIANLYVRYVLAGRSVNEILVVTFTNAATEELRGRIRARLHTCQLLLDHLFAADVDTAEVPGAAQLAVRMEGCIANEKDVFLQNLLRQWHACVQAEQEQGIQILVQARTRLKLAVRSMDEAAIFTIHGFCQRALNDHAFHSGQAFQLDIASADDQLWVDALKDWWRRESYELSAQQEVLFFSALRGLDDVLSRQKMLRETRNRKVLPEVTTSLQEFYQSWQSALKPVSRLAKIWQQRHEELKHILLTSSAISRTAKNGYKLAELPEHFALWDEIFSAETFEGDPRQLQMLSAAHLQENSKPKQKGTDPDLFDPFFTDCESVLQVTDQIRSTFAIRALVEATDFARGQVEQIKQRSRTLSYNDLLTRLNDALEGPQGKALANNLRVAFPVAMIDEFQDTDAIQYGIFRSIYLSAEAKQAEVSLIMIGDPKQAIYSFRGGDIFTYIKARQDAGSNLFTLDTNWRSVPSLVQAANSLFGNRADPFIYSDAIVFAPVNPAINPAPAYLSQSNKPIPALTIWQLPFDRDGKRLSKNRAEQLIHESVATEIHSLLEQSQSGELTLGVNSLQAGDMAVLVRDSKQGVGVRQALLQRGINAVTVGRDKVFASAEAHGLLKLISAVLHCGDRKRLRQALTSELLNFSYSDMAAIAEDEANWLRWAEDFKALHVLWQQKGFMAMLQVMLQKLELGLRLAATELAERSLTNTLHLAELLQQRTRVHPGQDALLDWFEQQINEAAEEETELRLESDEALVKIVTIHASKGLEYPIVFVPYLWSCKPCEFKRNKVLSFHSTDGKACLDLGSDQRDAHEIHAERERLAEDMRLLYVAVTRARSKVYLTWGSIGWSSSEKSALAYLLIPKQSAEDLQTNLPGAFSNEDDLVAPLQKLVSNSSGNIELIPLPDNHTEGRLVDAQQTPPVLQAQEFSGHIATDWRITSFSALTRDVHQTTHSGSPRNAEDPILSFPAGSHVGLFLHSVLEELDFQQPLPSQLDILIDAHAARHGLEAARIRKPVTDWIEYILHTPLQDKGFCLAQLPTRQRLNELAFDFSVHKADITRLNQVLEKNAPEPFAHSLPRLSASDFRGMVTGIIDLVFVHDGRYYIADYKSNFLGGSLQDYAPEKLLIAMLERRYDLQYLLYALALQRFLRQRLPDYSHARHFGGVYYLFLRGMRPQLGASSGVFFTRPDEQLLNELDQLVFATQPVGQGEPA